jgi:hypothetical protein
MAQAFLGAVADAEIEVDSEIYPGSHSRPYWERELPELFAWLRAHLRHPVHPRRSFSVSSAHEAFRAWDWSFVVRRAVREFLYLRVSANGLVATGSGMVDVVTPSRYRPGGAYLLRVGGETSVARADEEGRLRFTVDLGPSHAEQQTDFGPNATSEWRTVRAQIPPRALGP